MKSLGLATMSLMCIPNFPREMTIAQVISLNKPGTSPVRISPNAFEVASFSGSTRRREGHGWCSDDIVQRSAQRSALIRWPLALGVNLSGFTGLLCSDTTCRARQCLIKLRPAAFNWTEFKQITSRKILNLRPSVPARKAL